MPQIIQEEDMLQENDIPVTVEINGHEIMFHESKYKQQSAMLTNFGEKLREAHGDNFDDSALNNDLELHENTPSKYGNMEEDLRKEDYKEPQQPVKRAEKNENYSIS